MKLAKISRKNKKGYISLNTRWIPTNDGSNINLECLEVKNSNIFFINIIIFKLYLINFVYFFETTAIFARFLKLTRYFNWKLINLFILFQAYVLHQGQSPQVH